MKYTIFTGIHNGRRFFDAFTDIDIEIFESDYIGDARFEYELSDEDIDALMAETAADDNLLDECLEILSGTDKKRFLRNMYRNDTERESIQDAVSYELRDMAIDNWKVDRLSELESKYREIA